ncbi:MAG: hypothetical protein HC848_06870 [Limnobacter sp.]|nr:hypothetical protein [Limnobacter sp.]
MNSTAKQSVRAAHTSRAYPILRGGRFFKLLVGLLAVLHAGFLLLQIKLLVAPFPVNELLDNALRHRFWSAPEWWLSARFVSGLLLLAGVYGLVSAFKQGVARRTAGWLALLLCAECAWFSAWVYLAYQPLLGGTL